MAVPYLLNEFVLGLIGHVANLLLCFSGKSVQVPQSNEDFILF